MAKKTVPPKLLTGLVSVNCDFKTTVPSDSVTQLAKIGLASVELIRTYKIKSEEDFREVVRVVTLAAERRKGIVEDYSEETAKADLAHITLTTKRGREMEPWDTIIDFGKKEMEAWRREQDRLKRVEEERIARERQRDIAQAAAEAKAITDKAEADAAAKRQEGNFTQARAIQQQATVQATAVQAAAEEVQEVILPSARPGIKGLGESRPWVGAIKDIMRTIRAVAGIPEHKCSKCGNVDPGVEGIPLQYEIPKKGGGIFGAPGEPEKARLALLNVTEPIINYLAKRFAREDIGIPGCAGDRDFSFRISSSGSSGLREEVDRRSSVLEDQSPEEGEWIL